jgi:hypothetical protein
MMFEGVLDDQPVRRPVGREAGHAQMLAAHSIAHNHDDNRRCFHSRFQGLVARAGLWDIGSGCIGSGAIRFNLCITYFGQRPIGFCVGQGRPDIRQTVVGRIHIAPEGRRFGNLRFDTRCEEKTE